MGEEDSLCIGLEAMATGASMATQQARLEAAGHRHGFGCFRGGHQPMVAGRALGREGGAAVATTLGKACQVGTLAVATHPRLSQPWFGSLWVSGRTVDHGEGGESHQRGIRRHLQPLPWGFSCRASTTHPLSRIPRDNFSNRVVRIDTSVATVRLWLEALSLFRGRQPLGP